MVRRGVPGQAGDKLRNKNRATKCRKVGSVRENVGIVVAQQVQTSPGRQEGEARFGQSEPVFANEQGLEPGPEGVEVE